jgi:4-diphosphocytidyl-2-C-methyl-D-erythritol kinase
MTVLRTLAPAKVNLGLFVGPVRDGDGRHELVSVMQSVSLADELTLVPGAGDRDGADEVVCPGLPGPPEDNLAARALSAFREASGWRGPPARLLVAKQIPLAAGLAGGSADAAATLRLAAHASGIEDPDLMHELAAALGADVSAQLHPGRWLATGAGELLQELPAPVGELALLLVPFAEGLATARVYQEADRLGAPRTPAELERLRRALVDQLGWGAALPSDPRLLGNDLQAAAVSLCPAIEHALAEVRDAGAQQSFVSGSGPTVVGLFSGTGAQPAVERARRSLGPRRPPAIACSPVDERAGAVLEDR